MTGQTQDKLVTLVKLHIFLDCVIRASKKKNTLRLLHAVKRLYFVDTFPTGCVCLNTHHLNGPLVGMVLLVQTLVDLLALQRGLLQTWKTHQK